jgi:hypothetical protein
VSVETKKETFKQGEKRVKVKQRRERKLASADVTKTGSRLSFAFLFLLKTSSIDLFGLV